MMRARLAARVFTVTVGTVTAGVAINQVLNDDRFSWNWVLVALGVTVLSALYAEVFSPQATSSRPSGQTVVRGRVGRAYLRQLRSSVAEMETIGIATQGEYVLKMEQVYVDLSLTPSPPHLTAEEPYLGRVPPPLPERRTLSSLLNEAEGHSIAIIGGPGSGKTTLVRHTALDLCERHWHIWRRLPIVLYLRDHIAKISGKEPPDLPVIATSTDWLQGKVPSEWLARRLNRGRCLVLFDGLDEVASEEERRRLVDWLQRQINLYPNNQFVVTSRPHGYLKNPLTNADILQVRRFTPDQISRFLHNWYYAIECRATGSTGATTKMAAAKKSDDLIGRIRREAALYDMAANPLLLTMIANVHRYRGELPGSRRALYSEMCDVLLHRRQEAKKLTDQSGMRGPQKERVARHLALEMMRRRTRDISAAEAKETIRQVLRQVSHRVTPALFLREAASSGLLVERELGVFEFAHLTLQEYLAAAAITPDTVNLLTEAVDDAWWQETTLLWCAAADATPVVEACLRSDTVRTLALAFACSEESLELAVETRERLEQLLTSRDAADSRSRRRLIAAVNADRWLRDVVWLDANTMMCANPVPEGLFSMFARDNDDETSYETAPIGDYSADWSDPAVGMLASDASAIVTWLNSLSNLEYTYRLPTENELTNPAVAQVADLSRHTVWATKDSDVFLYRQEGCLWPYTVNSSDVYHQLEADRGLTDTFLRLALRIAAGGSERPEMRVETISRVVADLSSDSWGPVPCLLLNLSLARALGEFAVPAIVKTDRAAEMGVAIGRDALEALSQATYRARELANAMGFVRSPRPRHPPTPRRVPHVRDLPLPDLGLARDLALDVSTEIAIALDEPSAIADGVMSRLLDTARALSVTFARVIDTVRTGDDPPFGSNRIHENEILIDDTSAVDLAWNLLWAESAAIRVTTTAYLSLLELAASGGHEYVGVTELNGTLTRLVETHTKYSPLTTDALPFQSLQAVARARPDDFQTNMWWAGIGNMVAPILDRSVPFNETTMACARIGILGQLAKLPPGEDSHAVKALLGLVSIQQRFLNRPAVPPNELLLLVRN